MVASRLGAQCQHLFLMNVPDEKLLIRLVDVGEFRCDGISLLRILMINPRTQHDSGEDYEGRAGREQPQAQFYVAVRGNKSFREKPKSVGTQGYVMTRRIRRGMVSYR